MKKQESFPRGNSVFNRIRHFNKTDVIWIASVTVFVLICLWVISVAFGGPKGFLFLRYDKAGTGAAADLPVIESQTVYEADGITVTVKSFGLFEGEPALALTAANTTTQLQHIEIEAVTVNGQPVSSVKMKTDRAEFTVLPVRFGGAVYDSSKKLDLNVGIWGTKRCYLTLDPEELAELGIDTVEEITLNMSVGSRNTEQNVVVTVKTNAAQ